MSHSMYSHVSVFACTCVYVCVSCQFYRVILLVPDIIDRVLLRDYVDLLLLKLGFEAVVIHQVKRRRRRRRKRRRRKKGERLH